MDFADRLAGGGHTEPVRRLVVGASIAAGAGRFRRDVAVGRGLLRRDVAEVEDDHAVLGPDRLASEIDRLEAAAHPAGACGGCDGLGVKQYFDAERLVLYPESSLAEGAIRGWDRRNVYYFQMLTSLAEQLDFDMDTPLEKLPKAVRKTIEGYGGKIAIHSEEGQGTTVIVTLADVDPASFVAVRVTR